MFSAIVHILRVSIGRVSVIVNRDIGYLGKLSVIAYSDLLTICQLVVLP